MKKKIIAMLLCLVTVLAGCSAKTEEEDVIVIAQNDFAGAYYRLTNMQNDTIALVEEMHQSNLEAQLRNPNDYWAEDEFFFLDYLPAYNADIADLAMLNEVDDWASISQYIISQIIANHGAIEGHIYASKNDINNYSISYSKSFYNPLKQNSEHGTKYMDVIYEGSINSFRIEGYTIFQSGGYVDDFFYEFAEIAPMTYIVQSDYERLFVSYDEFGINTFAYSEIMTLDRGDEVLPGVKISDNELTVNVNFLETTSETDQIGSETNPYRDENAYHSDEDSMFSNLAGIDISWVVDYEDTVYSKTIFYDREKTNVTTTNVLTKEQTLLTIYPPIVDEEGNVTYKPTEKEIITIPNKKMDRIIAAMETQPMNTSKLFSVKAPATVNFEVEFADKVTDIILIAPNGEQLLANYDDSVESLISENMLYFTITNAMAGEWSVKYAKSDAVTFFVKEDINVTLLSNNVDLGEHEDIPLFDVSKYENASIYDLLKMRTEAGEESFMMFILPETEVWNFAVIWDTHAPEITLIDEDDNEIELLTRGTEEEDKLFFEDDILLELDEGTYFVKFDEGENSNIKVYRERDEIVKASAEDEEEVAEESEEEEE